MFLLDTIVRIHLFRSSLPFKMSDDFSFSIREKVAARPDEGQSGKQENLLTDWPDDAQHIDPAVDESSFGRECGVS